MTETFAGIFEVLAADQSDARLASRKALVLSRDRIDARLGKFLAASKSPTEFDARYDLVSEDFAGIVRVAADEVGHDDPDSLIETLHSHYREAGKPPWLEDDDSDEEEAEEPKSKKNKKKDKKDKKDKGEDCDEGDDSLEFAAKTAGAVTFQRTADESDLARRLREAECPKCGGLEPGEASGAADICSCDPPFNRGKKDSRTAADDKVTCESCGGEGCSGCAFTGKGYPKGKNQKEIEESDAKEKESSVRVADEGNTGLAGPSPKMDKKRWTPKSVKPIDVPSERHPTVQKDITEVMPKENEGPPGDAHNLEEIWSLTTTETLPTGTGLDDAGFAGNNQDMAPHTKTFGDGGQADPVKSESLEA